MLLDVRVRVPQIPDVRGNGLVFFAEICVVLERVGKQDDVGLCDHKHRQHEHQKVYGLAQLYTDAVHDRPGFRGLAPGRRPRLPDLIGDAQAFVGCRRHQLAHAIVAVP
ncbi:MAG: hypothetical protein USCGTAYLOR_00266 [Chromatiales bacterium USCg_Taylor]|nr:MAG: hypothetical protein USCGTAYLOR_00266 [Chromatiales bacterium USCg_Taylor]